MARLFTTFLFLCALLSALVSAFPADCQQQTPSWRKITNRIIAKVWRVDENANHQQKHGDGTKSAVKPTSAAYHARYGQDVVLRFNITNAEEALAIADASDDLYLDIWEVNENWVDIRLAKDVLPSFLGLLPPSLQKAHAPLMPESALADMISSALPRHEHHSFSSTLRPTSKDLFFAEYQPLGVIHPWLRLLASMFPTHAELITIGQSEEGRDILALRVGTHPSDEDPQHPRKTILISGGLHAREWISVSSVTYVAYQMVALYGKSKRITRLLETFDFVFVPTLNPDGYAYTWETDRLWRKNRQATSLRFCQGMDLDRAFGFEWDGDARPENPCSESYAGESAWQATEAKAFADWARNETDNNGAKFVALLDLHSYSQQVLYPYSFSCSAAPPTLEDLEELALGLAKAMKISSHGHAYRANSACEGNVNVLRSTSNKIGGKERESRPQIILGGGSLLDWAYHELHVPYAFQIKLRDMGSYGFLLPKENIVPQGNELLGAVAYLGKFLRGEIGVAEEDADEREDPLGELLGYDHTAEGEASVGDDAKEGDGEEVYTDEQWELRRRRRK